MERFTLSRDTILDGDSPEYFWVSWMCGENLSLPEIQNYIIKSFGGDAEIASAMISVAKRKMSKTSLLQLIELKNNAFHLQ